MSTAHKADSEPEFVRRQYAFAAHIRDPETNPGPVDVEDRRMAIYRDLLFNNVESFLAGSFPVVRQVLADEQWEALARDFFSRHRCRTPLFAEIAQEFLRYLQNERTASEGEPPFLLELAHYEWVELALQVSDADQCLPPVDPNGDLTLGVPLFSPLAWNLSYQFPVHRIGPGFVPERPGEQPTLLVVYRDRAGDVHFLEINPVTYRLIELMKSDDGKTGHEMVKQVADELNHPRPEVVLDAGLKLLQELRSRNIIIGIRPQGD
jgi:hypothetical protein